MAKKLFILASAIAALGALAAPAVANATPVLTSSDNPGVPIAKGKAVNGTANSTSVRLETETETFGTLECEQIVLGGEVTKNEGGTVEGKGAGESTTSGCTLEGGPSVNVHDIEIIHLSSSEVMGETGTGEFSAKYLADLPGGVTCEFSNVGKTAGVFHYKLGTGILIITPTNVSNAGCGESSLQGEVTLETGGGTRALTSEGDVVPPETPIVGTADDSGVRLELATELFGTLECEEIVLSGEVTKNEGGTVEGQGAGASEANGCTIEGWTSVNVHDIEIIHVSSSEVMGETGTGKFSAKFSADYPGFTCQYNTEGEVGIFHFVLNTDILIITPTAVGSPGCGEAFLQGEVTLETENGAPVTVGPVTGTPVTIS